MADLTQTPANVAYENGATLRDNLQAGEAISQGMPVYKKAADNKYYKAITTDVNTSKVYGIALTPAAADGYFSVVTAGNMNLGATLVAGNPYEVSTTAGKIAAGGDAGGTDYVCGLGVAKNTSIFCVNITWIGATGTT